MKLYKKGVLNIKEIWKTIKGYENYQVSNMGNVKNIITGKILKGQNNGRGYLHVVLYNNMHVGKTIMIHRLVAKAFIPNQDNLPQVNHKDENKKNNCVDNLEWITLKDNINHGTHNLRVGINNPNRVPIYSVTKSGDVTYFESAREAVKYYAEKNINIHYSGISQALAGKLDTYRQLAWYPQSNKNGLTEYINKFEYESKRRHKRIYCISNDNEIKHFKSMQSALKFYGLPPHKSVNLKLALDNETEFNGMKWFYDK